MMDRLGLYWAERSPRERWMLGVMFALLAIVILWFGIAVPLDRAQRDARDRLVEATERSLAAIDDSATPPSAPRPISSRRCRARQPMSDRPCRSTSLSGRAPGRPA